MEQYLSDIFACEYLLVHFVFNHNGYKKRKLRAIEELTTKVAWYWHWDTTLWWLFYVDCDVQVKCCKTILKFLYLYEKIKTNDLELQLGF